MFDEEFIKKLPDEPILASAEICGRFEYIYQFHANDQRRIQEYDQYLEALAFVEVFSKMNTLELKIPSINHRQEKIPCIRKIRTFFNNWSNDLRIELQALESAGKYETAKQHYGRLFGKGVSYEFSDDDFERVQELLNRLRDLLTKSEDFEEDHRLRLLKKLEALQRELHKRMSNFDKFWGYFIDSGIALSKFWENAEPFRNDVKELFEIVCKTQAKAENVQKLFPFNLLSGGEDKKSEG